MKNQSVQKQILILTGAVLAVAAMTGIAVDSEAKATKAHAKRVDAAAARRAMAPKLEQLAIKMDPVGSTGRQGLRQNDINSALAAALQEKSASQRQYENHIASERPAKTEQRARLKVELGDEFGGASARSMREAIVTERPIGSRYDVQRIESRLDRESREAQRLGRDPSSRE